MARFLLILGCLALAACSAPQREIPPAGPKSGGGAAQVTPLVDGGDRQQSRRAARNFIEVVQRVEPVAEAVCRERSPQLDCDFAIVVDDTINAPPNAFQTVDETGRPIIAFTIPLILMTRNQDELAFIMAHEAAHHIRDHLSLQRQAANIGASVLGQLVGRGDTRAQQAAQQIGASIGSRIYSKDFELEADALGTVITARAGFDPLQGALFFERIPDPGNLFLGTHPANAERLATVQRVAAGL